MRVAFHFQIQESGCQLVTRFVVALIHGRRSWCNLLAASWILAWTFVRSGVGLFSDYLSKLPCWLFHSQPLVPLLPKNQSVYIYIGRIHPICLVIIG